MILMTHSLGELLCSLGDAFVLCGQHGQLSAVAIVRTGGMTVSSFYYSGDEKPLASQPGAQSV
jgi:hypothetical protein